MFVTIEEINTHLYAEIVEAISREDETILGAAMDAAMSEVKGYLSNYDTTAIFASTGANRHPLLLTFVKDIAVWHFIALSNPSVDMELRKNRYERAIAWLKGVQKGDIVPDLPRIDSEDTTGIFVYGSNPKRTNHF